MKTSGYIDFAAVKAAVSFEQILEHYGLLSALREEGAGHRICCPIHQGSNPSEFSVTLGKNAWKCFSTCDRGGNHLDFVALMEDCTPNRAAWKFNEWFNLGMEKQTARKSPKRAESPKENAADAGNRPNAKKATKGTHSPSEAPSRKETGENVVLSFALTNLDGAHPYLTERGIQPETTAHFGIGYCPGGIMGGRIAIPIHNASGQIVANAGRWPGDPPEGKEKYRLPGGFVKTLEVFNLHRAVREPEHLPLVIVEGFFPVFHLWQHGIRRVVSLMGSHLSDRQEERIAGILTPQSRILLMLDNDDAGIEATRSILPRLAGHCFVKAFRWPEGLTQPDQLGAEHTGQILTGTCPKPEPDFTSD